MIREQTQTYRFVELLQESPHIRSLFCEHLLRQSAFPLPLYSSLIISITLKLFSQDPLYRALLEQRSKCFQDSFASFSRDLIKQCIVCIGQGLAETQRERELACVQCMSRDRRRRPLLITKAPLFSSLNIQAHTHTHTLSLSFSFFLFLFLSLSLSFSFSFSLSLSLSLSLFSHSLT